MQDKPAHKQDTETFSPRPDIRGFAPSIEMSDIFRQLIVDEIRNGRLTATRRRRIVRYAAQLGLSAVEAGRLITECREKVLRSVEPVEGRRPLRIVEPAQRLIPDAIRVALAAACLILGAILLASRLW